jgi:hypothetical protein
MIVLYFCTIIIVFFVVRFLMLFALERISGRLNLAHSKLLPKTYRRQAVEARRLSNWLHQKSTPTQTDQRPLETLKSLKIAPNFLLLSQ